MHDQTHDEEQARQEQQRQQADQTASVDHTKAAADELARQSYRPLQTEELQRQAKHDEAALQQEWPELKPEAERALKAEFQRISQDAEQLRQRIEEILREAPEVSEDVADAARRFVDDALSNTRREINDARNDARETGGELSLDVQQRMQERHERLVAAEETLDKDMRKLADEPSRQNLLDNQARADADLRKELWELSGRELEREHLQAFRAEADLPDQAVVQRDNDLYTANVSMARVMDNIRQLTESETVDANASNSHQQESRVLADENWQRQQRADESALAQSWSELNPRAEGKLKEAFRDVSEQANASREVLEEATAAQGVSATKVEQMRSLLDEEMRLARRDVIEARRDAEAQDGKVSKEVLERLDAREGRLADMERELDRSLGQKARDYLDANGLKEVLDRYRNVLADDAAWREAEMKRAQANQEGEAQVRAELEETRQQLRELDNLYDARVSQMRPDLVEARLREQDGQERLRIDMVDFTHRVNEIVHTAKAHVYRDVAQEAFPNAEVSMLEYRSPSMNRQLETAEEWRQSLDRQMRIREEEIAKRRRENMY